MMSNYTRINTHVYTHILNTEGLRNLNNEPSFLSIQNFFVNFFIFYRNFAWGEGGLEDSK